MFGLIGWGLDAVIIMMLFAVMSKLDEIAKGLSRLQAAAKGKPETPPVATPQ
jgi:hypothetical protein